MRGRRGRRGRRTRGLHIWATCGYVVARGRYLCRVLHVVVSLWFSSLSVHFCEQRRLTRTGSATGTDGGCRSGLFRSATGTDGGCRSGQLAATWWHGAGNYSAFSTLSSTSCSLRVPFCAPPRNVSLLFSLRPFRVLLPVADLNRGLLGSKVLHTLCTHVVSFRYFAISFSPRTCKFVIYFGFLSMILLLPLWLRAGRREDSVPRGATSSGATLQCCFGRCTTAAHDKQT